MLTERERQIVTLIGTGEGRGGIAERLGLSLSTVDKHLRGLRDKLGATSQTDLAVKAAALAADTERLPRTPTGHDLRSLKPEGAPPTPGFTGIGDFETLFAALHAALAPFGITHVVYSLIALDGAAIRHVSTRWSFPEEIRFDLSIPAEENPAFLHAARSWSPAPLDLEAMAASDLYAYVPAAVRAQNDHFIAAGMARGITFVLPGCAPAERLVLSTLMRHASPEALARAVGAIDAMHGILMQFRHAHVALAVPRFALEPRAEAVMQGLAEGLSPDAVAARHGISRRAVDRALAEARAIVGAETTTGAVALWQADRMRPDLPF